MRISVIGAPLFTLCVASLSWAQNPASMTPQAGTPPPPSVAPPVPATPPAPSELKPQAAAASPPAAPSAAPAASAASVAPATPSEPKADAVVDWYQPGPRDPRLPPHGAEHWRHRDLTRMAAYGMVDGHSFVLGRVSGVGTELRVGASGRYVGLTLGTYLPTADVSIGADFFRHSGWRAAGSGARALWLLAPTLEPRVFFSPRFDAGAGQRTIVALGSSLFGLRLTHEHCLVDLRLPRVDGWVMPFTSRTSGAMSVGASLVLGYAF